jgi:hypothetical protein
MIIMEFSNVSDIGNFEIEDLMDIPTQTLVGKRHDEPNGRFSCPISETDFQTKLLECKWVSWGFECKHRIILHSNPLPIDLLILAWD